MSCIAYFDCFSGISGDMILGACLDLGINENIFRAELGKLKTDGFELMTDKVKKKGIAATKVTVLVEKDKKIRHLEDIVKIISNCELSKDVKDMSIKIFSRLAQAEACIHGTVPEKVHFHEVGALDAIVDIVGSSICFEMLGLERVFTSRINVGSGFIKCQHGVIPVPAPATLELLRGFPVFSKGEQEMATPTGAAIVSTITNGYSPVPPLIINKIGYGAGERDFEIPNLLRIILGQEA